MQLVNSGKSHSPVHKQTDGCNCGPFTITCAAGILHRKSSMEAAFDVSEMRRHLIICLEQQELTPFPKFKETEEIFFKT